MDKKTAGPIPPLLVEAIKNASTDRLYTRLAEFTKQAKEGQFNLQVAELFVDCMEKTVLCIEEELFSRSGTSNVLPFKPPTDTDKGED